MCGRFDLHSEPVVIRKEFRIDHVAVEHKPSYNIAPTRQIVIVKDDGKRHLVQSRWGLLPAWTTDTKMQMINAKAETVADKPAFKEAFRLRRCLVIADGFFEWRKEGKLRQPVYIRLKSKRPFGFAGLYNISKSADGEEILSCAIITTEPNELLMPIHDRMPAIIAKDKEDLWLKPDNRDIQILMSLLVPYPSEEMEYYEVSQLVNKPDNDSIEIINPI